MGPSRESRFGISMSSPAGRGGEDDLSELLGSDLRSPISGVSVGMRDWRHVTVRCAAAREPARWVNVKARETNEWQRLSTAEKASPAKETWSEYSTGGEEDGFQKSSFKEVDRSNEEDKNRPKEDDKSRAREGARKREHPKEAGRRS